MTRRRVTTLFFLLKQRLRCCRMDSALWKNVAFFLYIFILICYLRACIDLLTGTSERVRPRARFLSGLQPRCKAISFHNTQTDSQPTYTAAVTLRGPILLNNLSFLCSDTFNFYLYLRLIIKRNFRLEKKHQSIQIAYILIMVKYIV